MRTVLALLLLTLPGCVAAIGNRGYGPHAWPSTSEPMLQERVATATRIVELQQRRLDSMRTLATSGQVGEAALLDAEIKVEEAKLVLSECRAELRAVEAKAKATN